MSERFPETSAGERRQLLGLAYRLLGSTADAEDAVQEAYVRLYRLAPDAREKIDAPGAWLMTATGRICLDVLGSARVRRERYVGEWLPEPLPGRDPIAGAAAPGDPADRVSMDESVSMALMVVLDTLTPAERVAFVLHDVFQYTFAEIAEIVGRTPQACRQLASTARGRIAQARTQPHAAARRGDILRAFKTAWETGDVDGLVGLLDPDIVVIADGGGKAQASLRPIHGAKRIVQFLTMTREKAPDLVLEETTVNGEEGLLGRDGSGDVIVVMAFGVDGERIQQVWAMRNPEKLLGWR
ncbi:MAG: RNA polymerase sigma factor SigJ [Pseudolysinimonas sp.]